MREILEHEHKGHLITVDNTWFTGARLLFDGRMADERRGYFHLNRDKPVLSGKLKTTEGEDAVVVFMEAIWKIKIILQIKGETVATLNI